ncbi:uncharacterized protein LOC131685911 [Topomyia yanbarensis]|uniref:uncharacterized protein LOC131685911 n=1 Tax=Topomyia yanbarensis TaxID=2498891 RepID=UPI00273B5BAE|nr:uncharacterized protein LOC131685911 [Topomyia yanbarensis]
MKFIILLAAIVLMVSTVASYPTLPVSTSVWPPYGVYGKSILPPAAVTSYPGVYGSWPWAGRNWGYSAPVVTNNGLWNYSGYGYAY